MSESQARARHLAEHGVEPSWARVGFRHPVPDLGTLHPPIPNRLVREVLKMRGRILGKAPNEVGEVAAQMQEIVPRRQRRKNWRESLDRVFVPALPGHGTHRERASEHRGSWPVVVKYGADYMANRLIAFFRALGGHA